MATQLGLWQVHTASRHRFGQEENPQSRAMYRRLGYSRARRLAARARYRRGLLRGAYDSRTRAANDREREDKRRVEAPQRALCGIGPWESWPSHFSPGGYDAIYYVADDVDSARRGGVGGVLCADCLNGEFTHNVVVAVESAADRDQPEYCDHCNRNIGAEEDPAVCPACDERRSGDTLWCGHCGAYDGEMLPGEQGVEVCAECGTDTPDEADSAAPFARTRYGPLCAECRDLYERDGRADWL